MQITKSQAREALGFEYDKDLAAYLGVGKGAVSNWGEDDPLPEGKQWQLRAKRPDLFPIPQERDQDIPRAA